METRDWLALVTVIQSGVMAAATGLLWSLRKTARDATDQTKILQRLDEHDKEIERLRRWRHEVIVPWQQNLMGQIEEKFYTRREKQAERDNGADSPFPNNRRRSK